MNLPRSTMTRMTALVLAAVTLSACAPTPTPSPTPTAAFASEEEAFAAAEDTYRAYNDAVNRQRDGDESADPLDFLTGKLLDSEIAAARELESSGVRIIGDSRITDFVGTRSHLDSVSIVEADVCLDISDARAIDSAGNDVTAADRSDVYAVSVTFTGASDQLLVSKYEVATDVKC